MQNNKKNWGGGLGLGIELGWSMGFSLGIGGSIGLGPRDRIRTGGEHDVRFRKHPPPPPSKKNCNITLVEQTNQLKIKSPS